MNKKPILLAFLISLVTAGCSTSPTLECQDLIKERWGFDERELGYDVDRPSRTQHKLITDEDGNVYILDMYNGRIAKFGSSGQFETHIELASIYQDAGEEFSDIAVSSAGQILVAISALTEFEVEQPGAYVAIYTYSPEGDLLYKLDDWRDSPELQERMELGQQYQIPFHYLVGGAGGSAFSIWTTGRITLHTPEGVRRMVYNMRWNQVVSGWDGYLYIVSTNPIFEEVLLIYETLNGNLVQRIDLKDWPAVKLMPPRDSLIGVDAERNLYFQRYDEFTDQLSVIVLDRDGSLKAELPIPGLLATVDSQGQLYLFSREKIPEEPFLVERCQLLPR